MEKGIFTENVKNIDFTKVYIAILVVLITIILFLIYRTRKTSRKSILLTGLCDSGKTLLYAKLVHGQSIQTFTSMKDNSGEYLVNGTTLKIVDIPGHERVRDKYFDQYRPQARAIVYVIDSTLIQEKIRDIAEYLYNILSCPDVSKNKVKVLVLCNKQDIPSSQNSAVIKSILEQELTTVQITKSNQLESVDAKNKKSAVLVNGGKFDFNLLSSVKVDFVDCNALSSENQSSNLESLQKWLSMLA